MSFRVWRSKPKEISPDPTWCCYSAGYLYIHDWLIGLVWQVLTEWKHDRHLVG